MKIIIDIPEEFEIDFKNDRFDECFSRIYYAASNSKSNIAGNYELETIEMLRKAFKSGFTGEYKSEKLLIDDNRPQCCIDHDKWFSVCDICEFGEENE